MIAIILIIHYDNDEILGSYFADCAQYAKAFLTTTDVLIHNIFDKYCNSVYIEQQLGSLSIDDVMLVVFSHGTKNAFTYSNVPFLSRDTQHIKNLTVYTNACATGQEFGPFLSLSGGVFIGYAADLTIPVGPQLDPHVRRIFIECDCYGLYVIFKEKVLLTELKQKIYDKFNYHIDKLKASNTKYWPLYAICI